MSTTTKKFVGKIWVLDGRRLSTPHTRCSQHIIHYTQNTRNTKHNTCNDTLNTDTTQQNMRNAQHLTHRAHIRIHTEQHTQHTFTTQIHSHNHDHKHRHDYNHKNYHKHDHEHNSTHNTQHAHIWAILVCSCPHCEQLLSRCSPSSVLYAFTSSAPLGSRPTGYFLLCRRAMGVAGSSLCLRGDPERQRYVSLVISRQGVVQGGSWSCRAVPTSSRASGDSDSLLCVLQRPNKYSHKQETADAGQ